MGLSPIMEKHIVPIGLLGLCKTRQFLRVCAFYINVIIHCVRNDGKNSHLWMDTQLANIRDRDKKGRQVASIGEKHGCAKLTKVDVLEIRRLYATGQWSHRKLGRKYDMHGTTIGDIIRKKIWKHV